MDVLERDFFTDPEILEDPIPYYRALHERGPVVREPHKGVFMLSRADEILEVYTDHERFSAIVGPLGPLTYVPEPAEGESWREVIERRRNEIPMGDQITSLDPPKHTRHRTLIGKLFTPRRIKENEEFMWTLADELIDEFADRAEVEFAAAYARPFTLLVIADLLGVPREDHETFRGWLGGEKGTVGDPEGRHFGDQVFANLHPYFSRYIEERRESPRDDVMSRLASVRFSDGELPEVMDVVRLATIIFAAGQETTARLLTAAMRIVAEQPALAEELRSDPQAVPNFVEECLRLESPNQLGNRLVSQRVTIGGVVLEPNTYLTLCIGAANRDAQEFPDPERFDIARRPNRHLAFAAGAHACAGMGVARLEAQIALLRTVQRLPRLQLAGGATRAKRARFRGFLSLPAEVS